MQCTLASSACFLSSRGTTFRFMYKRGKELYIEATLSCAYTDTKPSGESNLQLEVMSVILISPIQLEELQKATL